MHYIVFDLEWNQSKTGLEKETKEIPFEIIEIGAVKLDEEFRLEDKFQRFIRPQVYRELHEVTRNLIHIKMEELETGKAFPLVMKEFLDWCGEDYIFCTWGPLDLTELQRNMKFYYMEPLADGPIKFYDVQKLFSIGFEDRKTRRALEHAVDFLQIEKDIPFHRAFSDAYYTAKVLAKIDKPVLINYSFDVFSAPKSKKEEIRIVFDNYMKHITREFDYKLELLSDREIMSVKCYICRKNIKRKIRWFTPNSKHYYSVGCCDVHGYMKAKIRVKKSEDDKIYAVKTLKLISEEEMNALKERGEKIKHIKNT